jgi:ABC-2 type transport system ATP-binding protein
LAQEKIELCLEKVGLKDARKQLIRTYSKGMQQRLAIAQAIVADPELVILDEPLSGLDPVGRIEIQDLLKALNQDGATIFFSSHILHDVETICHQVAFIVKGELKYSGSPEKIESTFKEILKL